MSEENWDDGDAEFIVSQTWRPKRNYEENRYVDKSSNRDEGSSRGYKKDRRIERGDNRNAGSGNQFTETVDVRNDSIGRIIGRAGSNIQRIQNDFHVHVQVDKNRNTVSVSGHYENDVKRALNHIEELMSSSDGGRGGHERHFNEQRQRFNIGQSGSRSGGGNFGGRNEDRWAKDGGYGSYRNADANEDIDRNAKPDFYNAYPEESTPTGIIDWSALNKKAEIEREKRWAKCPPLTKNFYKEHKEVANLSAEEAEQIRASNNNTTVSRVFEQQECKPKDIPNPIWKFEQCFDAYPDLLGEIYKQEFVKPTPIQAQAWPVLLRGEDLIGIAQTGTGKTLAFLLPAMIHTEYQSIPRSERGGPNVLILAPTRELALQIEKEVNKYSFRGMKAVCVYGGGDRREQINTVQGGVEIIICTPGRLNDLIQANVIQVSSVTYLILDEADRMLDMGFEPQIRKVLLDIRPDRQTVMTSATWPPGVRRLAESYMNNPIQVCVGSLDLAATHSVEQIVEICDDNDKYYMIRQFIKNMQPIDKIIIFCGRKTRADDLASDLCLEGVLCQCIHGSRDQSDREKAIADISSGDVRILIATDVASRGLDIEDITHVINFDFPRNIEEYVHRVGRTGRAGRRGMSISYVTRSDWSMAQELIDILKEAEQVIPDRLHDMATRFKAMKDRRADEISKFRNRGGSGGRGGGGKRGYN